MSLRSREGVHRGLDAKLIRRIGSPSSFRGTVIASCENGCAKHERGNGDGTREVDGWHAARQRHCEVVHRLNDTACPVRWLVPETGSCRAQRSVRPAAIPAPAWAAPRGGMSKGQNKHNRGAYSTVNSVHTLRRIDRRTTCSDCISTHHERIAAPLASTGAQPGPHHCRATVVQLQIGRRAAQDVQVRVCCLVHHIRYHLLHASALPRARAEAASGRVRLELVVEGWGVAQLSPMRRARVSCAAVSGCALFAARRRRRRSFSPFFVVPSALVPRSFRVRLARFTFHPVPPVRHPRRRSAARHLVLCAVWAQHQHTYPGYLVGTPLSPYSVTRFGFEEALKRLLGRGKSARDYVVVVVARDEGRDARRRR